KVVVLRVDENSFALGIQTAQDLLAGLLLDLVIVEVQAKHPLHDLLHRHRQRHWLADLGLVFTKPLGGDVLDVLVRQEFGSAHSPSSISPRSRSSCSSSSLAILRKASGRSSTRCLMSSGIFLASRSNSSW